MERKIKLVWEFYGVDALKTADHHLIHLSQYIQREDIDIIDKGVELINEFSAISFIIIYNSFAVKLRSDLKPKKGLLVQ